MVFCIKTPPIEVFGVGEAFLDFAVIQKFWNTKLLESIVVGLTESGIEAMDLS